MGDSSSTTPNPRRDYSAASEAEGDKLRSDAATQQAKINALNLAKKGGGFVSKTDMYTAPGLRQWDTTTEAGRKAAARYPGGPDTVEKVGGSFADAEGDFTTTDSSRPWYEQAIAGGTMPDNVSEGYSGPHASSGSFFGPFSWQFSRFNQENWTPGSAGDKAIKAGAAVQDTGVATNLSDTGQGTTSTSMWGAANAAARRGGAQQNLDAAMAKKRVIGGDQSTLG
jgi:hypothetical protein